MLGDVVHFKKKVLYYYI